MIFPFTGTLATNPKSKVVIHRMIPTGNYSMGIHDLLCELNLSLLYNTDVVTEAFYNLVIQSEGTVKGEVRVISENEIDELISKNYDVTSLNNFPYHNLIDYKTGQSTQVDDNTYIPLMRLDITSVLNSNKGCSRVFFYVRLYSSTHSFTILSYSDDYPIINGYYYTQNRAFDSNRFYKKDRGRLGQEYTSSFLDDYSLVLPIASTSSPTMPLNYRIMINRKLNKKIPIIDSYMLFNETKSFGFYIFHINGYSDFDYMSHDVFYHYYGITAEEAYTDLYGGTASVYDINIYVDSVTMSYTILGNNQYQMLNQGAVDQRYIVIKTIDGRKVSIELNGVKMYIREITSSTALDMKQEMSNGTLEDNNGNLILRTFDTLYDIEYIKEAYFETEKLKLVVDANCSSDQTTYNFRIRLYRTDDNGIIDTNSLFIDNTYIYLDGELINVIDNINTLELLYTFNHLHKTNKYECYQFEIENMLPNSDFTEKYIYYLRSKYSKYDLVNYPDKYLYYDDGYDLIASADETGRYQIYQGYHTVNGEQTFLKQAVSPKEYNVLLNGKFTNSLSSWEALEAEVIENQYIKNIIGDYICNFPISTSGINDEYCISQAVSRRGIGGDEWCFSLWGKGTQSISGYFRVKIDVKSNNRVVESFTYSFNKIYTSFQPLYGEFTTSRGYSEIVFSIEYKGSIDFAIGNVKLYKKVRSRLPIFDDKLLVRHIAKNEKINQYKYDDYNRIIAKDSDGDYISYSYNNHNQLSTERSHSTGNKVEYQYNDKGYLINEQFSNKYNSILSSTYDVNDSGEILSVTNEKDQTIFNRYDAYHRIIEVTNHNGITDKYSYTNYDALLKRNTHLNYKEDEATYEYDNFRRLISITNKVGSKYEFIYDDYENLSKVKLDGVALSTITYKNPSSIVSKVQFGDDTISNYFKYNYDSNYALKSISYNDLIKSEYSFTYNDNHLLESVNAESLIRNYTYDSVGNVISETVVENDVVQNELLYTYDDDKIKASSYLFNDKQRMYLFDYPDDCYECSIRGYLDKLANRLQGDAVVGYKGAETIFSDSLLSSNYDYISTNATSVSLIKLVCNQSYLEYSLQSLNSNRLDKSNYQGSIFNRVKWEEEYQNKKSINIWFKSSNYNYTRSIAKIYKDNQFKFGLLITTDKHLGVYLDEYNLANNTYINTDYEILTNWNYIRINLIDDSIQLTINEYSYYPITNTQFENIHTINKVRFACENADSSINDLSYLTIAYIGFNCNCEAFYGNKMIYMYGIEFLSGNNAKKISRVTYIDEDLYKHYDVIPLNGSLVSLKGTKPSNYGKRDLYRYDFITNRLVYSSNIAFGDVEYDLRELSYQTQLGNNGTIIIWVKPEGTFSTFSKRYVLCCQHGASEFFIYIDNTHKLYVEHNGRTYSHDVYLKQDDWNMIACICDDVNMKLKINDLPLQVYAPYVIDLTNTYIYIGSKFVRLQQEDFDPHGLSIQNVAYSSSIATFDELTKMYNEMGMIHVANEFDDNNRIRSRTVALKNIEHTKIYRYYGETSAMQLLPSSEVSHTGEEIIYTKDEDDNITRKLTINSDGELVSIDEYAYDELKMLKEEVRYNHNTFAYKYRYQYDTSGNITVKQKLGENDNLIYQDVYMYSVVQKSLLQKVIRQENGTNQVLYDITYSGYYPTSIKKGTTLNNITFRGPNMTTYGSYHYDYDENGRRITKSTSSVLAKYTYDNNNIIRVTYPQTSVIIDYHFDQSNTVIGFNYNGNEYFFDRDITGNINKVFDKTGKVLVKYEYTAYGEVTKLNGDNLTTDELEVASSIKQYNIYLYKGYCYDEETGLFWLSSRYYSPELCRFISPDSIEYLDPESINGLNLYCYCFNNPISYSDPSGHLPEWWQWALLGAGVLLVAGAITVLTCGVGTSVMVGTLKGAMLHGAAVGTLIGAGVGVAGGAIIGGAVTDWSAEGIIEGMMIGFGGGAIAGAIIGATVGGIHYGWQQSVLRRAGSFSSYADEATELHHIVEQCQIKKSGFSSKLIRNSNNEVRIAKSLHSKVSSYYSSLYKSTGMRFRNYLAANHYSLGSQYNKGIRVLNMILKGMI